MSGVNINWPLGCVRRPPAAPLDLSNSQQHRFLHVEDGSNPPLNAFNLNSCQECKELRKEVREVRDDLKVLMEQFTTFASSWTQKFAEKPRTNTTPEIPDSSTAKSSGSVQSPPSSASSGHEEVTSNMRAQSKDTPDRQSSDRFSPASSNGSNASSNSQRKRKMKSAEQLKNNAVGICTESLTTPLNVATDSMQFKRARTMNYGLNPNLQMPNQPPLGFGSSFQGLPPAAWSLLWGLPQGMPQNWPQGPPNPFQAINLHSQFGHRPSMPGTSNGDRIKKGLSPSPPSDGSNSSEGHNQADSSLLRARPHAIAVNSEPNHMKIVKNEQNVPLAPTSQAASLQVVNSSYAIASNAGKSENNGMDKEKIKKRPGPDDFIKEFLELEMAQEEEKGKVYQIPVPDAMQHDRNFHPMSEEDILRSCRWEELDWQESVTRLAKKLAEKRVFGPALMSRTTVAGSNHSNYPNLPLEGIMYIESVCRRVLFPGMSRKQFSEFFRPAIKGLAARCRRIRHSLKPSPTGESPPHPHLGEIIPKQEVINDDDVDEDEELIVADVSD